MTTRSQLEICVNYDEKVAAATRNLRVLPLAWPNQSVTLENWTCEPSPTHANECSDRFGNRVLTLRHRFIAQNLRFCLQIEAKTTPTTLPATPRGVWKMPSSLVRFDGDHAALLQSSRQMAPLQRATFWNEWVFSHLRYEHQNLAAPLDSTQIWAQKSGSCADFAHLFLALARQSGLFARYVAGFNPSQGLLHAWCEVIIAGHWHGFDPTHGRAPAPGCLAVATGRDFHDCAPHIGNFRGNARSTLQMTCATTVETQ